MIQDYDSGEQPTENQKYHQKHDTIKMSSLY